MTSILHSRSGLSLPSRLCNVWPAITVASCQAARLSGNSSPNYCESREQLATGCVLGACLFFQLPKEARNLPSHNGPSVPQAGAASGYAISGSPPVQSSALRRVPGRVLPPLLEISLGALWQIVAPCRFERRACSLKACGGAVPIVTGIAARIEAANPLLPEWQICSITGITRWPEEV